MNSARYQNKDYWLTAFGSWGDCIASYGNICRFLNSREKDKANVVYFGMDENIVRFLKAQDRIDKVRHLKVNDPNAYRLYQFMAMADFDRFTEETGLADELPNIFPTHLTEHALTGMIHREMTVNLPDAQANWAGFLKPHGPFVLVQPWSVQSCTMLNHWPHWTEAITRIADESDLKVVLVGQIRNACDPDYVFPWIDHPNVLNLVGQTPSMIDVLHLARLATGVVTTSNCLSLFSVPENKATLVACHQLLKTKGAYFHTWISVEPNTVLESDTTLDEFVEVFKRWRSDLPTLDG